MVPRRRDSRQLHLLVHSTKLEESMILSIEKLIRRRFSHLPWTRTCKMCELYEDTLVRMLSLSSLGLEILAD